MARPGPAAGRQTAGQTGKIMFKSLEHHEHAEHMAHGHADHAEPAASPHNSQMAALLVAVLAAGLALAEQGAKHAEIRVQENAIFATDAWSQYQAKSTRGTFSKDLAEMTTLLQSTEPGFEAKKTKLLDRLAKEQERFERDPKDGKIAIAERAHGFEEERNHSLEQTHAYHNGSAAMELGIVLSTASAIIKSRPLLLMALVIGVVGAVFAVLGYVAPELGAL